MDKHRAETGMRFGIAGILVSIGVVYGDIGTSPMYVLKSIIAENGGASAIGQELVLGSLSLIIWTMTLLTTVKYVMIAMKADNHGEGGIFALFTLVKRHRKWLVIPAMIGGAALLADGMLTPAVTVTTAIEGLRSIPAIYDIIGDDQSRIIIITIAIISALFMMQKLGTAAIGKAFGPIMVVWFVFLAAFGMRNIVLVPYVLKALNPIWAIRILFSPANKVGIFILGSVFLATTGAEALYSDMGHTGKRNIYASWPFVKICLILNYLGQGAWLLDNVDTFALVKYPADMNPFFEMLPHELRLVGVVLGTVAAIIASQALITGSFTLVSEAIRLDLMPHMRIMYPAITKGQLYIPLVNGVLWFSCSALVLFFQSSARMEAAYGLAITMTMLMTTILLYYYIAKERKKRLSGIVFLLFFGGIESVFILSSLSKFTRGGYVALLMAMLLLAIMLIWKRGTEIEASQSVYLHMREYLPLLKELRGDKEVPPLTENLAYITKDRASDEVDRDVLYSVFDKSPKRATAYWFISIHVTDEPYTREYSVENFGTDYVFKINLNLGFRIEQRVNVYLRQIVEDMVSSGELPSQHRKYTVYEPSDVGPFLFCITRKTLAPESSVSKVDRRIIALKYTIRHFAGGISRWYGLENSNQLVEYVPLFIKSRHVRPLKRIS